MNHFKHPIVIASAVLAFLVVGVGFWFVSKPTQSSAIFYPIQKQDLTEEVSITGPVASAAAVDLALERSGEIVRVNAKVGDTVFVGQTLVALDTNDLQIKLENQRLALEKAKIILAKNEPKTNAEDDLKKAYEDGFNTVSNAFLDLPTIISGLDDILTSGRHSPYLADQKLQFIGGDTAREYHDTVARAYYATDKNFDALLKRYKTLTRNSPPEELESMLNDTYTLSKQFSDTIKDTHNLVDYVENKIDLSQRGPEIDRDQAVLDAYTAEVNTHLAELLKIKDIIKYSREGITDNAFDISSTKIDIQQKELDIQDTLNQINNRIIRSPISGTITRQDARVGAIASPNVSLVSVISNAAFQIEALVSESEVAKIHAGNDVSVTLDAYGNGVSFGATVASIDPSATVNQGVPSYRVVIQFKEKDDRIRTGMTGNAHIITAQKQSVLAIPWSSVIARNGASFVIVKNPDGTTSERQIQTGIRSGDMVEVASGLTEGELVASFGINR